MLKMLCLCGNINVSDLWFSTVSSSQCLYLFQVKELSWLPSPLPPQCKLILTTTSTDLTYKSLTLRPDVHALTCPGLSDPGARRRLLLHHLPLPSLAPPAPLLQDLLRGRLGCLPLYLALVAGELQTCGVLRGAREVEGLMEGYTEVDSVAELWVRVVQRWSRDYGDGVYEGTPSMAEQTKPLALVSETGRSIFCRLLHGKDKYVQVSKYVTSCAQVQQGQIAL